MSINDYLFKNEKRYNYRIKTVVELNDESLDIIERVIMKYVPIEMSSVRKTILQKQPLDFVDIQNSEVYMVDLSFTLPASAYVLSKELIVALNINPSLLVVRADNDPMEIETGRLNFEKDAKEEIGDGTRNSFLTDPEYKEFDHTDGKNYYGDQYNSGLQAYLNKVKNEKDCGKIDAPHPLFKWMDMPNKTDDDLDEYNKSIDGAPKVYPKYDDKMVQMKNVSTQGALDDEGLTRKRVYRDASGKEKTFIKTDNKMGGGK